MSVVKIFDGVNFRTRWDDDEECWYFVVQDVIAFLTDSPNPSDYWYRLKQRELDSTGIELSTICRLLKFPAPNGKIYKYECANNEAMFRIVQAIPSPKAEPFKRWLARLGKERIEEIEKPEKAIARGKTYYRMKGRDEDWINKRMTAIATRNNLTDYWKDSGVKDKEYGVLTDEIYHSTFNLKAYQYKQVKGLEKKDSLRDNMNPLELVITMFAEQTSKEIAEAKSAQGLEENKTAINEAGKIASQAITEIEKKTGKKVVSKQNFKHLDTPDKTTEIAQSENRSISATEYDNLLIHLTKTSPEKRKK